MDRGLQRARAGVVLLTPANVAGRFWTERELGALLHKALLIPVLHNVTFAEVAEYSGILPDLAGFERRGIRSTSSRTRPRRWSSPSTPLSDPLPGRRRQAPIHVWGRNVAGLGGRTTLRGVVGVL